MLEKCKTAEEAALISRDAKLHFEKMEKSQKPVFLLNFDENLNFLYSSDCGRHNGRVHGRWLGAGNGMPLPDCRQLIQNPIGLA